MTITILGKKKKFIFILFHTKPLLGLNRVECVFVQLEKQVNYFSVTLLLSQVFQKVSPQKEYLKRTRNAAQWRTILKKQKIASSLIKQIVQISLKIMLVLSLVFDLLIF